MRTLCFFALATMVVSIPKHDQFSSVEEALAAGHTQEEVDAWLAEHKDPQEGVEEPPTDDTPNDSPNTEPEPEPEEAEPGPVTDATPPSETEQAPEMDEHGHPVGPPSSHLTDEEKTSGMCEEYCRNSCAHFAWGADTIKECNGCEPGKTYKCAPGAKHYGDKWVHEERVEEMSQDEHREL